jgi:hypothetical protein
MDSLTSPPQKQHMFNQLDCPRNSLEGMRLPHMCQKDKTAYLDRERLK